MARSKTLMGKHTSIQARCTVHEAKLVHRAAKKVGLSVSNFVRGAAKLQAVLMLGEEDKELVHDAMAKQFGLLIEGLNDRLESAKKSKVSAVG